MESLVFQTSLVAAFVAGMVALFAPCCITFLLPAYLGSVFKEKEKVVLMTLVFGLGIFTVLLPAVLGVAFISQSLFRYHDTIYILGALVMVIVSVITFLGVKLPMPALPSTIPQREDVLSIFMLGIFSGITSACCAPVLIGILALTFLSPSFFGALAIGGMYVLGMVMPLLLISLFLSGRIDRLTLLRKRVGEITLIGKTYSITVGNSIAAATFLITGIVILALTLSGKLAMGNTMVFTKMIQDTATMVDRYIGQNIPANILLVLVVGYVIYVLMKNIKK